MIRSAVLALLLACSLTSCKDLFQYSPNEIRLDEAEKNLNQKNIDRLKSHHPGNNFRFIVVGDSQRFYDELDDFVDHVNGMHDISFIVLNGDISDFGLNREFKWINRSLNRLKVPYICVIGNHDMLANGRIVYNQMFGAENFSFDYGKSKFVFFNSNSEEVGFNGSLPDMNWIEKELNSGSEHENIFMFSHVPPFSPAFDPELVDHYTKSLAQHGVRLSIHGHQHHFSLSQPYGDGVEYCVVGSMNKRNFALIHVTDETYGIEQVSF